MSYYININTKSLTTNLNNTKVKDRSTYEFMSEQLCPVDNLNDILKQPIQLSDTTTYNKMTNSLQLSQGATVLLNDGYKVKVTENGVEVIGGNPQNQTAWQEATDVADALSTLLRNSSGVQKAVGYSNAEIKKWNDNIEKILPYFGVDISKEFSINGTSYLKGENGIWISEKAKIAFNEYKKLLKQNETYKLADEKTKKQIENISQYYLENLSDEVKEAWEQALKETDINPFPQGHISVFSQVALEYDCETGGNRDFLGNSKESCIKQIDYILKRIEEEKSQDDSDSYINNEKVFYTNFLSKLI